VLPLLGADPYTVETALGAANQQRLHERSPLHGAGRPRAGAAGTAALYDEPLSRWPECAGTEPPSDPSCASHRPLTRVNTHAGSSQRGTKVTEKLEAEGLAVGGGRAYLNGCRRL
jgi:hypothetical protein